MVLTLVVVMSLFSLTLSHGFSSTSDGQLMMFLKDTRSGDPPIPFDASPVTGSCKCASVSCECCQHIKFLTINNEACLNVTYIEPENIALLAVTWGGKIVYNKKVSVKDPHHLCSHVPYIGQLVDVCIKLYNINYSKGLSGCASLTLKFLKRFEPLKVNIGCFHIPFLKYKLSAIYGSTMDVTRTIFRQIIRNAIEQSVVERKYGWSHRFRAITENVSEVDKTVNSIF